MSLNRSFARQLRMDRLYRHHDERLLIVPLDHSVTDGPLIGGCRLNGLVGQLARAGVDAVVLHKGALRYVDHRWFTQVRLVVHLSASTSQAPDPNAKYLVAGVEEALRIGADAVSVHVNLGSAQEARQIGDLALIADACDRWNVPLLSMIYPRGPNISDPYAPELVAHAVSLAADLGADAVKTVYTGDVESMSAITANSPLPVIVAGGQVRTGDALTTYAAEALSAGAGGLAIGRSVFLSASPGEVSRRLAELVHPQSNLPDEPYGHPQAPALTNELLKEDVRA